MMTGLVFTSRVCQLANTAFVSCASACCACDALWAERPVKTHGQLCVSLCWDVASVARQPAMPFCRASGYSTSLAELRQCYAFQHRAMGGPPPVARVRVRQSAGKFDDKSGGLSASSHTCDCAMIPVVCYMPAAHPIHNRAPNQHADQPTHQTHQPHQLTSLRRMVGIAVCWLIG